MDHIFTEAAGKVFAKFINWHMVATNYAESPAGLLKAKAISRLFNLAAKCVGDGPLGATAKAAAKNMHLLEGVSELEIMQGNVIKDLVSFVDAIEKEDYNGEQVEALRSFILKFAAVLKRVGLDELHLEVLDLVTENTLGQIRTFIRDYESKVETPIREKREEVIAELRKNHVNLNFNGGRCPR